MFIFCEGRILKILYHSSIKDEFTQQIPSEPKTSYPSVKSYALAQS